MVVLTQNERKEQRRHDLDKLSSKTVFMKSPFCPPVRLEI